MNRLPANARQWTLIKDCSSSPLAVAGHKLTLPDSEMSVILRSANNHRRWSEIYDGCRFKNEVSGEWIEFVASGLFWLHHAQVYLPSGRVVKDWFLCVSGQVSPEEAGAFYLSEFTRDPLYRWRPLHQHYTWFGPTTQ